MNSSPAKKIFVITSLSIFVGTFFVIANNAEAIEYTAQVGFGAFKTGIPMNIDGNSIGTYIKEIYKYSVGVVGILASIIVMWGGTRWITAGGDKGAVDDAKKWISGAISGLILILTSYFILNFINPDMVNFRSIEVEKITSGNGESMYVRNSTKENCPEITIDGKTQTYRSPEEVTPNDAVYCPDKTMGCCATFSYTSKSANTATDKGVAPAGSGIKDTSVVTGIEGLFSYQKGINTNDAKPELINEMLSLSRISGLKAPDLIVTSVTTGDHNDGSYSHANGYKVDLKPTDALTSYVENGTNFTGKGTRSDGAEMYQSNATGACYALESSHWDVSTQNCPPPIKK